MFGKLKHIFGKLSDTQKKHLIEALQRQKKRILADNRLITLSKSAEISGRRLETLIQGATQALNQNRPLELKRALNEAISQAKVSKTLYKRVEAFEHYLAQQTRKLLKQIKE